MRRLLEAALLLAMCAFVSGLATADDAKKDLYNNYKELAAHAREGVYYRIELVDHGAPVSVLAIHGGRIENGSDDAARLIAGADANFYAFIATKPDHNRELHLISSHFDEPQALALTHRSDRCVSMHGFALEGGSGVACIGGGNPRLAKAVHDALKAHAPEIMLEYPCARFGGDDPENILNRCVHQGVQIEMSPALREKLKADPTLAAKFKTAVREGVGLKP